MKRGATGGKKRATDEATGRPTIIDVARVVGVSPATVSNALNNRPYVDADTRKKVKAAADKLGYTPNLRARRLRTGRADTIAIFSSMPFAVAAAGRARLGYLMEVAASAAAKALQSGIALILVPPLEESRPPLDDLHIDGALVVEPVADDPDVARLRSRGIPVVSIGRQPGKHDFPFVDIRSYDAASLLLNHLHEQSARHVGLVLGMRATNTFQETKRAYADFTKARRTLPVVARVDENEGENGAYTSTLALLREHPGLDALYVAVDTFAVGAASAASQLGLALPENLKIVTRYDGAPARECQPPLTALNLHLDDIAALGVELLLEHVQGERTRTSVLGPRPTLVCRSSSTRTSTQ
jgi:DNA-binding LacI/PurR family transcriptional regulator